MTGTHDYRDERLRRQAEDALRARPPLPAWQRRVLERFAVERRHNWFTLLNQFAPHTPDARPDVILVGPLGVLVVLLREDEPSWENSRKAFVWTAELLAGVSTPQGLLTEAVLRTVVVHPIGRRTVPAHNGEHLMVSERELDRILRFGERVLEPPDTAAIAAHLDNRTFDLTPIAWHPRRIPEPRGTAATRNEALFTSEDVRSEQFEYALRGPFRDWRIFLDDTQLGVVRRHYSGPARITGPAGTGKSVLALHRLAYLARRTTGRLLLTTHLRNLAAVASNQFAALSPQLTRRVEFTHLHAWARAFLTERGRSADVDAEQVDAAFQEVWDHAERSAELRAMRPSPSYWRDEIDRVIKGRGIGTLEAYRSVSRKGRGMHLSPEFRAKVWEFYCEYERQLTERGVYDHNDILIQALDELVRKPLPERYAAVVVDEVQDLTLVGLRLVREISGDGPNQLLLVGDGEQQVYAGGWRLSEAGISLQGRGEVLRRNYRNRTAVVETAAEIDAVNRFDDLDGGPSFGLRSALAVLEGGRTIQWQGPDQEIGLVEALRALGSTTDVAVLTTTNRSAELWMKTLRDAGFEVSPLDRWEGRSSTAVHVGTVHRAKGTEFRAVFLPDEPADNRTMHREEREAFRRRRLVAMTRARDYLWVGTLGTSA